LDNPRDDYIGGSGVSLNADHYIGVTGGQLPAVTITLLAAGGNEPPDPLHLEHL